MALIARCLQKKTCIPKAAKHIRGFSPHPPKPASLHMHFREQDTREEKKHPALQPCSGLYGTEEAKLHLDKAQPLFLAPSCQRQE